MLHDETRVRRETREYLADLDAVVKEMIKSLEWKAALQKNVVVSRIGGDFPLQLPTPLLKVILQYLLNGVISCSRNGHVSLHAKNYTNVTLVHVKCSGTNTIALETYLHRLQPVVEKIKGSVGITSQVDGVTTVTLGFPQVL